MMNMNADPMISQPLHRFDCSIDGTVVNYDHFIIVGQPIENRP